MGLDLLQDRVTNIYDIEQTLSQNLLGVVPHVDRKMDTGEMASVSLQDKFSQLSEAFAGIRGALLAQGNRPEVGGWVILVAGTMPAEGKTSVSSNLAIAMSGMSRRVLLVDGDMRRPKLDQVYEFASPEKGLMDVLADETSDVAAFTEMVRSTEVENLYVATGKPAQGVSPTEVLETGRLKEFIDWARAVYDVVIIDSPPLIPVHDALVLGRMADDVVLVARHNRCRKAFLRQSILALRKNKCPLTGVVLNDFSFSKGNGGQRYGSYAYYGTYTTDGRDD